MTDIHPTKYTYWGSLNKPYLIVMTIIGIIEFYLYYLGTLLGLIFGMFCVVAIIYGFYMALPPKWVREHIDVQSEVNRE